MDDLQKKQSPPLTESEILSTYRNDFFSIDDPQYFKCKRYYLKERGLYKKIFKRLERYCAEQSEDSGY